MNIEGFINSNIDQIKDIVVNSSLQIGLVLLVILLTIFTDRIIRMFLKNFFEKSTRKLQIDKTQFNFLKHFITLIIYTIGFGVAIYLIESLRTLAVSLFAGAGIIAIIIGFASQQAFSNLVAGIFMVIYKPVRVGDWVKVGQSENGIRGVIEDITLRHTVIKDWQNRRIIIPNTVMNSEIIENSNLEDEKICKWIEFGISYDSDINIAIKIIQSEAKKHPLSIDVRTAEEKENKVPVVQVRVVNVGEYSILLRAYVWTRTPPDSWVMSCDLNKIIKERFDKEGIEIPFPYRTLVYKKDIKRKVRK
ncbi:mechanosensitive ion channel family protein [Candidatus Woesearchaeota archaeon]|nr:mechanosensitive ion channel family protein [Candidatus Woesearchaeota archaeon]